MKRTVYLVSLLACALSASAQGPGEDVQYVPRATADAALRACRKAGVATDDWRAKVLGRKKCAYRYEKTLRRNATIRWALPARSALASELARCRRQAGDASQAAACTLVQERAAKLLEVVLSDVRSELLEAQRDVSMQLDACQMKSDGSGTAAHYAWMRAAQSWWERLERYVEKGGESPGWSVPQPPRPCRSEGERSKAVW